jgi:anaerobic magnesium-protoporphyrin IX monomethyl ester cyclase
MILLMTTAPPEKSPWGKPGKLPPLGLAFIAAVLEQNGYEVQIYDNYLLERTIEEVMSEVRRHSPEIVGISCTSLTYSRCIEVARAVKEVLPSCRIIVGGPHPSYMPQTMLDHMDIDYVVIGEGEQAMVKLAESILRGEKETVIANISGVACRIGGKIVKTAPEFISDLDQIPFPARHLLPMQMYERVLSYLSVKPVDTMSVLRGCPYTCAYCETWKLWGNTFRASSPQRVVEEIKYMTENYGSKGIYFVGDNFTINKKRTMELCQQIKNIRKDVIWACETRTDLISKELLVEMRSAGCQTISFGIESGAPAIQQKLNKNIDLQQVKQTFKLCRRMGIQTTASFMLGIPGETVNDMNTTLKFAKSLNADWCQFNIYVSCPGSRLYDEIISQGLYDQMYNYLARVKTNEFDYEMLVEIQRDFQRSCEKSAISKLMRVIKQEGLGSAFKKGTSFVFHR